MGSRLLVLGVEPDTVVLDEDADAPVPCVQCHARRGRRSVSDDVGECLLDDPVDDGLCLGGQPLVGVQGRGVEIDGLAGPGREVLGEALKCRHEPDVVKHCWS